MAVSKKVEETPLIPEVLEQLPKELIRVFQQYGFRLNGCLLKDGSEEMEGDLVLANNVPTVEEHAASKKYVDDAILAAGGGLPSGTRVFFDQDSAPTDWTRDTGINDRVIRIVSGARAHGGSWTIGGLTGASTNTAAGGTVAGVGLSTAQLAAHAHIQQKRSGGAGGGADADGLRTSGGVIPWVQSTNTANAGSGSTHTHGFTGIGHNHPISVAHTPGWRPLHRDVIVASKD